MGYTTLMVHLQLGTSNAVSLQVAGDLAGRFHAKVIGIAACQPLLTTYDSGCWSGGAIEECRAELEREIQVAEMEFHAALRSRVSDLTWRSNLTLDPVADYLAREVRSSDLLITGLTQSGSLFDRSRYVNIGELVMQAGRPVLVVPASAERRGFERVVIGWKDTRESRRAVVDALPLLQHATHVCVVEITAEPELEAVRTRLADVVEWLGRHGVTAEAMASPPTGDDDSGLDDIANQQRADVIVAGAYGHSRLREWALGGMTRQLILRPGRCSLVSH